MGEVQEELPGFAVGAPGVGRGVGFEPEAEGFGPFLGLGDLLMLSKGGEDAVLQNDIRPCGIPRKTRDATQRTAFPKGRFAARGGVWKHELISDLDN